MGIEIRLPQITGATEKEQLAQIKSYLYQFAEQLQWGLQNVNTSSNSAVVVQEMAKSLYPTGNTGSGTVQDPLATFAAIKSLIIKSADIVDAYYDEITKKLSGLLVAHSDFGTFVQETEHNVKENSTSIERNFTNVQAIIDTKVSDLSDDIGQVGDELKDAKDSIDKNIQKINGDLEPLTPYSEYLYQTYSRIKTGLLEEKNGISVYGIEVGQRDTITDKNGKKEEVFYKFARFTSDGLTFYDKGGHPVAYISDYKLYITYAEVLAQLKLGGFRVDTSDGLTVKWEGR